MPQKLPAPTKRSTKWFGWIPDIPDKRDLLLKAPPAKAPPLPRLVDLRGQCPPAYNQGNLGSCTANAIGADLQFIQRKQKQPEFIPSRLFIYYNERVILGTVCDDSGAMLRDGIKSVAKQGAPPETDWPYNISRFTEKPPPAAYKTALDHQAIKYQRVTQTRQGINATIAAGYPIVFGFAVYESFDTTGVTKYGILPMPKRSESMLGGHAVLNVGYAPDLREVHSLGNRLALPAWVRAVKLWAIIHNSYSERFGDKGRFYMPMDYLADHDLSSDYWVIQTSE